MAEAVRELVARGAVTSASTREQLSLAAATILDAGIAAGTIRRTVRPEDVVAAMAAVVLTGTDRAQVDRLLDLIVAGVRTVGSRV